jgi:hypothetical protein
VQATLDDNNTDKSDARRSRRRSLSFATLLLLWLAVPLAAVVMKKLLIGS